MYVCVRVCYVGERGWEGVCARVALIIQHATRRHIAICGLSECTKFFGILINGTIFGKTLINIKCVVFFNFL